MSGSQIYNSPTDSLANFEARRVKTTRDETEVANT